jgi:hypothetical protein
VSLVGASNETARISGRKCSESGRRISAVRPSNTWAAAPPAALSNAAAAIARHALHSFDSIASSDCNDSPCEKAV